LKRLHPRATETEAATKLASARDAEIPEGPAEAARNARLSGNCVLVHKEGIIKLSDYKFVPVILIFLVCSVAFGKFYQTLLNSAVL
jgi:hypothetical protein